jgi:hypothetical protein
VIASRPHLSDDATSPLWQWQKLKAAEVNAMTDLEFRVFENRMRRAAQGQGLTLIKFRRRDPRALDYGGHWLVDLSTSDLVAGGEFGVILREVALELLS